MQSRTGTRKQLRLSRHPAEPSRAKPKARPGTESTPRSLALEFHFTGVRLTPGDKPAALVVMHHTFDPEAVVAESSRLVPRSDTVTVDCLFHETVGGLLDSCPINEQAVRRVSKALKLKKKLEEKPEKGKSRPSV